MKILLFFLLALLNFQFLYGQSLSQKDLIDLSSCPDFDCFERSVLSKGITLKEKPYNDAFGGKHQLIFNSSYDQPNIEVYSVGITFKDNLTTVLLRSKNKDYLLKILESLFVWGKFENSLLNQTDGSTTFSMYKSKNYPNCTLRTETFYDNDDKLYYYVVKLTQPTKIADNKKTEEQSTLQTEPTVEIRTKTHTLKVYPGWANIFNNSEKATELLIIHTDKNPAEIFKEAPDGWLKKTTHLYSSSIKFEEVEAYTLEKSKQSFIERAVRRTGWTNEKIKILEEPVSLSDGRKGQILFYVCPDNNGMVGGNYLYCELDVESNKNKNNITSYTFLTEGGCPELPQEDYSAWKDYFKKVLLTIKPN